MRSLTISLVTVLVFSLTPAFAQAASEVEQMKAALVGKSMGGREKGWTFQSPAQIKELVINKRTEGARLRVYSVIMILHDPRVPGVYRAEADMTYARVGQTWEIEGLGLKSLVKIE